MVGNTGFVGANLIREFNSFDKVANSKNVGEMYGDKPDILVYAGITGTKWYANLHEFEDQLVINAAIRNINNINPHKLILISTIDVYDDLEGKDEDYCSDIGNLHIYGKHRYELENWVKKEINDYYIIRLPAIYGNGIKKNFIYDLIHMIPKFIRTEMLEKIKCQIPDIEASYTKSGDVFVLKNNLPRSHLSKLRNMFIKSDVNALIFTNRESQYQFYNLQYLWKDICIILANDIRVINIVPETLPSGSVYQFVYQKDMPDISEVKAVKYNLKSKYTTRLHFSSPIHKRDILKDVDMFVKSEICRCYDLN